MNDLKTENNKLKQEVETLKLTNKSLIQELEILKSHPTIAMGMRGESLVASWINGAITTNNASHDIETLSGCLKIEVKHSKLNIAVRERQKKETETLRWAWAKIFGESGNKNYDRIILIGNVDHRYREHYLDPKSPYIIFDVPFNDVFDLTIKTNKGKFRSIQLTTNPKTAKSKGSKLFEKYQIKLDELAKRYGI